MDGEKWIRSERRRLVRTNDCCYLKVSWLVVKEVQREIALHYGKWVPIDDPATGRS